MVFLPQDRFDSSRNSERSFLASFAENPAKATVFITKFALLPAQTFSCSFLASKTKMVAPANVVNQESALSLMPVHNKATILSIQRA
ncbi:hypothetical protein D9542_09505 [Corynebacterium macginleyi]|nr:hypothetical protein D9542_09505 [Corynebacterium macginleyi]